MRRIPRLDANHRAVVDALKAIGASVESLASMGHSVPDLLVGYRGLTMLLEVKTPGYIGPRGGRGNRRDRERLDAQAEWAARWRGGRVHFVTSPQEAVAAVTRPFAPLSRSDATGTADRDPGES